MIGVMILLDNPCKQNIMFKKIKDTHSTDFNLIESIYSLINFQLSHSKLNYTYKLYKGIGEFHKYQIKAW